VSIRRSRHPAFGHIREDRLHTLRYCGSLSSHQGQIARVKAQLRQQLLHAPPIFIPSQFQYRNHRIRMYARRSSGKSKRPHHEGTKEKRWSDDGERRAEHLGKSDGR